MESKETKPAIFPAGDDFFNASSFEARLHEYGVGIDLLGIIGRPGDDVKTLPSAQASFTMAWARLKEFAIFTVGLVAQYEAVHGVIPAPRVRGSSTQPGDTPKAIN